LDVAVAGKRMPIKGETRILRKDSRLSIMIILVPFKMTRTAVSLLYIYAMAGNSPAFTNA
jgi:hypothetical protein